MNSCDISAAAHLQGVGELDHTNLQITPRFPITPTQAPTVKHVLLTPPALPSSLSVRLLCLYFASPGSPGTLSALTFFTSPLFSLHHLYTSLPPRPSLFSQALCQPAASLQRLPSAASPSFDRQIIGRKTSR